MLHKIPNRHVDANSSNLLTTHPTTGNTIFHDDLLNNVSYKNLKTLLHSTHEDIASHIARTVNNEGLLPVDLVEKTSLSENKKLKISDLLHDLMSTYELKHLSAPISIDDIQKQYYSTHNTQLNYHLNLACIAANKSRRILKESETHTQANHYPDEKRLTFKKQVKVMRRNYESSCNQSSANIDVLKNMISYLKLYRTGNCNEFSYFSLYQILKLDPSVSAEIFCIDNGDHVFLVIGRDQNSDINDYTTWGNSAVICDAWSGNIFPAYLLADILADYGCIEKTDGSFLNVILNFNPQFHKLTRDFSLTTDEKRAYLTNLRAMGFFSKQTPTSQKLTQPASQRLFR